MLNRPKIDITIVREGNRMKFTVGNASLALIPVEEGRQVYDFLALEQFITRIAIIEYGAIVKREQIKKDLASLLEPDVKTPGEK